MRDPERLRDSEKSSPGGHKAVLAFCALLLLGGVFSLGVLIGKRTTAAPAPAAGDLAALDAEARKAPAPRPLQAPQPATPPPAHVAVESAEPVRAATIVPPPARPAAVIPAPAAPHETHVAAPPAPLTPPPRDVGAFTVQVGASQDRSEASRLESRLRGAGLRPYVVQANLGAKGSWYRIRVGAFRDKDSANRFRKDVERELRMAAVVMPTR